MGVEFNIQQEDIVLSKIFRNIYGANKSFVSVLTYLTEFLLFLQKYFLYEFILVK